MKSRFKNRLAADKVPQHVYQMESLLNKGTYEHIKDFIDVSVSCVDDGVCLLIIDYYFHVSSKLMFLFRQTPYNISDGLRYIFQ